MTRLIALSVVGLVLVAGCVGGVPADGSGLPSTGHTATAAGPDTSGQPTDGSDAGRVNFYVSDQPNAIGDFRHLNVTVSRVGFQHAEAENGSGSGGWEEYGVENRSVDLTRLRGDNATLIESFDVPNGTYTTVFVHVEQVHGTLANGESVRVKLPSEKLQIHQRFAVSQNESVDFVFDIAVHEAGKSGKYILRPVVSESGTSVPITDVDRNDRPTGGSRPNGNASIAAGGGSYAVHLLDDIGPGEPATVRVTDNGTPVANAAIIVNGEDAGVTGPDGTLTVELPEDVETVTVTVAAGDEEVQVDRDY